MTQQTCAERIDEMKNCRMLDIENAKTETEKEEILEGVLEISLCKTIKILLSWGGPADWYELEYNATDELVGGSYHFQNWGDHAEKNLTPDERRKVEDAYLCGDPSPILSR